jgi:hypothetical protein
MVYFKKWSKQGEALNTLIYNFALEYAITEGSPILSQHTCGPFTSQHVAHHSKIAAIR